MELATAAVGSLLPKLGTLLSDEYKLQKGVRGEIRFLRAEMESMQVALNKVSKQPPHQIDDDVKIWARDLKELSYDIEDSVDTFIVRIDTPVCTKPHSFRKFFDRIIGLLTKAKTRHSIANDIQDIKRRIHEVSGRRGRYKFEDAEVQPDTKPIDPRFLASFEHAAKLVGIDGPTEKIVNLVTQGAGVQKQRLMVVSIVGVGGLGKTTIANSVYQKLGGQFECQAFVSVSLKPNMKQIFSSILRQVSEDKCTSAGEKDTEELIRSIRKFLMDKRYIIVVDDVWDENAWNIINCALIDNNLDSRVILTTRNADVAKTSSVDGATYELDPLSGTDSKRLFFKRIFNEEEGINSELEEVSNKILKKCGGVPLAIITIGNLLAAMPNETKYEWYRVYNSMYSGLEKDKTMENMRGILSLSYGDLPSYLKPCLLYLSMFPEDYMIPRDSLVRMWVAEGFVDGKQGRNLYELGERYFNELVNRNMIQRVDMDDNGSARACRVHDMILDLIISVSTEENFVSISERPQLTSPVSMIRRLSLQYKDVKAEEYIEVGNKEEEVKLPASVDISHVRTLFGDASEWMLPLSRFPVLRVLLLKCFPARNNHPKDLGILRHLRYLELGGDLETELLEEIGNLRLLKTLDLRRSLIVGLPASIVQLTQLENLLIDTMVELPDGIGNLRSLQELSWLDVQESPNTLVELGNLNELRVLSINGLHNDVYVEIFLQSLSALRKIRTLNLGGRSVCFLGCLSDQWSVPSCLQIFNGGNATVWQVPGWFSSLCELSFLSINVKMLTQDDLQLLGALPMLRFLELQVAQDGSADEWLVIGIDHPFRSLAEFKFKHGAKCGLVFDRGVMPKLQKLQLYYVVQNREGGSFDFGMENLTSLKHITVVVDCEGAWIMEVEIAEVTIRHAIDHHPSHPTLQLSRYREWLMAKDENKNDGEASEQEIRWTQ